MRHLGAARRKVCGTCRALGCARAALCLLCPLGPLLLFYAVLYLGKAGAVADAAGQAPYR